VVIGNGAETCNSVPEAHEVDEDQPSQTTTKELQPLIEIISDAAGDEADATDEEVSAISARMPPPGELDLDLPQISVQIASPVILSPSDKEEGVLCSAMEKYANAWTGNFDVEDEDVSQQMDSVDDAETFGVRGGQGMDMDDRPLSPTDYTLEDESDFIQPETDAFQLDCRAPSPSEYSLLTESTEENDLTQRLIHAAPAMPPEDLFAIPDPSPSSAEMNIYLAMHDQFACSHRRLENDTNDIMPGILTSNA